jgi:hypothetical protein
MQTTNFKIILCNLNTVIYNMLVHFVILSVAFMQIDIRFLPVLWFTHVLTEFQVVKSSYSEYILGTDGRKGSLELWNRSRIVLTKYTECSWLYLLGKGVEL